MIINTQRTQLRLQKLSVGLDSTNQFRLVQNLLRLRNIIFHPRNAFQAKKALLFSPRGNNLLSIALFSRS